MIIHIIYIDKHMFCFSKRSRLSSYKDFCFVFSKPTKHVTTNFIILNRFNNLSYPRIGISISKKSIKLSHDRNKIKRLIRESFRLHCRILQNIDFVIIVKYKVNQLSNYVILKNLKQIWKYYFRI